MGWWTTEEDCTIGDEPADLVTALLLQIVELKNQEDAPKPALSELLNIILATLKNKPDAFDEGSEISIKRIVAITESEKQKIFSSDELSSVDNCLMELISDTFEEIAVSYEDSELERKPSVNELLENFSFVLGVEPDEYLSLSQNVSIVKIFAELD